MSVAIGIDLGTTNTVVAAVVDGVAVTLEDEQGRRLLPSVVSFHPSSTVLVGEPARERRLIDPENTIYSIKPLLGRAFDSDEVGAARARFPFQLTQGAKNSTMVLARDVAYALPEISAFVLRRAKSIAEAALGQPIDRAVITVPANFNDLQRASTKIAGKLAGLEVMRILNEPTAAALAYGQSIAKAEKISVYDLGGGTFDVTLLDLTGNVFEVLATAGDTALGGDDIDRILAERIAIEVLRRYNVDPRTNPASNARLSFMAEELKKELSTSYQAQREITGIGYTDGGHPITMPFVMTREELENLTRPLIERTIAVAKQSIEIIGLSARDFDRVILVGGSTRMPLVARMVEQLFNQPPHLKVNPDEVVALGAAIQAHALNRSKGAHKRRISAHDQLANAQAQQAQPATASGEQQTRPPTADPTATVADRPSVPKAPPLPNLGAPAAQVAAAANPQFFSFSKAPAMISFEETKDEPRPPPPVPPTAPRPAGAGAASPAATIVDAKPAGELAPPQAPAGKPRLPLPSAPVLKARVPTIQSFKPEPPTNRLRPTPPDLPKPPPPVPPPSERKLPPPVPPIQKRGGTDHQTSEPARTSIRPIEGAPARIAHAEAGPKPARRSANPTGPNDIGPIPELIIPPGSRGLPARSEPHAQVHPRGNTHAHANANAIAEAAAAASANATANAAIADATASANAIAPVVEEDNTTTTADAGSIDPSAIEVELNESDIFRGVDLAQKGPPPLRSSSKQDLAVKSPSAERFHQGSAIATSASTPLLIDVTPLSLGVETVGGYADVLIPANSPVPCEKTRTFLTASDRQTTVSIRVAQGSSSRFAANTRLGDLELSGLREARRGEVKIVVTFELDADGILNVRARDHDTGRETVATMRLLGTSTDAEDMGAMQARQARHVVA